MKLRRMSSSRRAVSPVLAMSLLIVLGISAAAGVGVLLTNLDERAPSVEGNYTLGASGSTTSDISINTEITKLSRDVSVRLQNISDYTQITIFLDYTGDYSNIYVIDFDIVVYGEKLDDISPWTIDNAVGATATTKNGEYSGYKQSNNSQAQYIVKIADSEINNTRARIPDKTTFGYYVKIGTEKGVVTHVLLKEREAKIIFNPIWYNVSIFHFSSSFNDQSAAGQFEQTFVSANSSNKLFYRYSRNVDAYDYSQPLSINTTWFAENYDAVIVDRWAVPLAISTIPVELHELDLPIIFYGGLEGLAGDITSIMAAIDTPATEYLTGLTPKPYTGGTTPSGTDNYYTFANSLDGVLAGLSGQSFAEVPWFPSWLYRGDRLGYDVANFTSSALVFKTYGTANYEFWASSRQSQWTVQNHLWNQTGTLMTFKDAVANVSGKVYSFVWKTSEDFSDALSQKTNAEHLLNVRNNMLSSMLSETDRLLDQQAVLVIDGITLAVRNNQDREFDIKIDMTVTKGDIAASSLVITLDMPDALPISSTDRYWLYVDGVKKTDISFEAFFGYNINYAANNVLTFDIASWFAESIPKNSIVSLVLDRNYQDGNWISLTNPYITPELWSVTADFKTGLLYSDGYTYYTQTIAVDDTSW